MGNDEHSFPKLRHTVVRCIELEHLRRVLGTILPIDARDFIEQQPQALVLPAESEPLDIFEQNDFRKRCFDEMEIRFER